MGSYDCNSANYIINKINIKEVNNKTNKVTNITNKANIKEINKVNNSNTKKVLNKNIEYLAKNRKIKKSNKLEILHFNCRGLASEERIYELEKALDKIRWDIIGLLEVRREGEKLIRRFNNNYFYYFGSTKGYRGMGFYVNKSLVPKIIEIKAFSDLGLN